MALFKRKQVTPKKNNKGSPKAKQILKPPAKPGMRLPKPAAKPAQTLSARITAASKAAAERAKQNLSRKPQLKPAVKPVTKPATKPAVTSASSLATMGTSTLKNNLASIKSATLQQTVSKLGAQTGIGAATATSLLSLQQQYEKSSKSTYSLSSSFNNLKTYLYNSIVAIPATIVAIFTALRAGNMTAWACVIVTVLLILLILYFTNKLPGINSSALTLSNMTKEAKNVANQLTSLNSGMSILSKFGKSVKSLESFADMDTKIDPSPFSLADVQPQTVKQAGYLGPHPEGLFHAQDGTSQALLSGIRSFILQIDYLDTSLGSDYAEPGIPCLLYRADDGTLMSKNSADIYKVTETIANLAFRPECPNHAAPIIIYLHVVRTPSPLRNPGEYKEFLSRIAIAMKPLAPQHLGMTPLGVFNRQKQESLLLTTPLKTFEGQVIILCNADTTTFRKGERIDPADDLDFWVNMRVYLGSPTDTIGVTQAPEPGVTPSALIVNAANIISMTSKQTDDFAITAKKAFVIAMTSQGSNPSTTELDTLLNKLGVNIVPLDIFGENAKQVVSLVGEYDGMPLRPKPAILRNKETTE